MLTTTTTVSVQGIHSFPFGVSREICKSCGSSNGVGFTVADDVWKAAVPILFQNHVLCLGCFTRFADEKLIAWDKQIEFWPVSFVTHLDLEEDHMDAVTLTVDTSEFDSALEQLIELAQKPDFQARYTRHFDQKPISDLFRFDPQPGNGTTLPITLKPTDRLVEFLAGPPSFPGE